MLVVLAEKAMAPHSSALAWKIPWTEEPGGLQSMGLLWVGHDWATSLSLFTFMHWRRKWKPTPVFLPGESQGRGSLVGCRLWGRTESDTNEATWQQQQQQWYLWKFLPVKARLHRRNRMQKWDTYCIICKTKSRARSSGYVWMFLNFLTCVLGLHSMCHLTL